MIDSLRDQLLNLGFKAPEPAPRPASAKGTNAAGKSPHPRGPGGKGGKAGKGGAPARAGQQARSGKRERGGRQGAPQAASGKSGSEMDLGKAWALRTQQEKQERIAAERARQEEAQQRRQARARLEELLQGKALNDPAAEIARHFEYGGKIKRIYVNEGQLKALNAGDLGVVQLNGRYLLVDAAVLAQAEAVFAQAVALKGPSTAPPTDAAPADDPYVDPRYQVPDDLVW